MSLRVAEEQYLNKLMALVRSKPEALLYAASPLGCLQGHLKTRSEHQVTITFILVAII